MKRIIAALVFLLLCSCHPLSLFRHKPFPPSLRVKDSDKIDEKHIHIAIDFYDIPFIKAKDSLTMSYGLGFMHARDRAFQLDLVRHIAQGRLSEVFGKKGLEFDRKYRIVSYKIKEQLDALSDEELKILQSYARGVNDGIKAHKRSAEHFLLGLQFEEFTVEQAISIARLQSWTLGQDLWTELYRLRIAKAQIPKAVKRELIAAVDAENSAIIREYFGNYEESFISPSYLERFDEDAQSSFLDSKIPLLSGGSNAWAVHGSLTKEKKALSFSDPHLSHNWLSNFYLAHVSTDDISASGATLVGLPSILIGASKKLSWGATASYVNTQDVVVLDMDKDQNSYWIDGQKYPLGIWRQRFCLDKHGDCFEENYYTSIFGPVIDNRYDPIVEKGDRLALMWTGFLTEHHHGMASEFLALMAAKNVAEGKKVVSSMTLPGINLILADTAGDIAFAYAGLVPKRDLSQNQYLPLDGTKLSSLWSGVLPPEQKPSAINPGEGFLVNANQNIYEKNAPNNLDFGKVGSAPYRALRIREVIENLKAKNDLSVPKLAAIQLDTISLEARDLASSLGAKCIATFKNANASKRAFAKEIHAFDANYSTSSLGALPFDILLKEIISTKMAMYLGQSSHEIKIATQVKFALTQALNRALKGEKNAIFGERLEQEIKTGCENAYDKLVAQAGKSPWRWRWGRHHYIYRKNPLAQAPLIGSWFKDRKRELAGTSTTPMAEGGTPVYHGANLRFSALMSDPPELNMMLDTHNSANYSGDSAHDLMQLWHEGKSIKLISDWQQALSKSKESFVLSVTD